MRLNESHSWIAMLFAFAVYAGVSFGHEPTIRVLGDQAAVESIRQALAGRSANVGKITEEEFARIGDGPIPDVIVLAPNTCLSPAFRGYVTKYLSAAGRLAVVGPQVFDYSPHPRDPHTLPLYGKGLSESASTEVAGEGELGVQVSGQVRRRNVSCPDGTTGVEWESLESGLPSLQLRFDARSVGRIGRNVLQFWARGDAYADVLSVEARDTAGRGWTALVPLARDWRQFSLSLADFLPNDWKSAAEPYPLLEPQSIETIGLGPNRSVLWNEKPMKMAVGGVALAESTASYYAPTSGLLALRPLFEQVGITPPAWIIDPFVNAVRVSGAVAFQDVGSGRRISASADVAQGAFQCPTPDPELPGTRMGTDTKPEKMLKFERETRRIEVISASSKSLPDTTVADLLVYSSGAFRGASIARFGRSPRMFFGSPSLVGALADTVLRMAAKPTIAGITPNAELRGAEVGNVVPSLRVVVENPLPQKISGVLRAEIAGGKIRGTAAAELSPRSATEVVIALSEVPEDFPFADYEWQVTLKSDAGDDVLADHVDVERALIFACEAMLSAQGCYPDGRITNHYFGDAYGARAMIAYADFLRRRPERLQRNLDLWSKINPDAIEASGLRFFDMLVKRQDPNGRVPMGYGEHTQSFNIADCGQMALNMSVVATIISESDRRQKYLKFCRSFLDNAEQLYIDPEAARRLAQQFPEKAEKKEVVAGHYGLGWSKGKVLPTGPSWVMPDILGAQIILGYLDGNKRYDSIWHRNAAAYLESGYSAAGYFQAEAFFWAYLLERTPTERAKYAALLKRTFLPAMLHAGENDMYTAGGRTFLKGLPLFYYRRAIADSPALRALQFKYTWALASEDAPNSMRRIAEKHIKPIHGESIAAIKQAECGAIWAIEMLDPGATLLRSEEIRRWYLDRTSR